MYRTIEERDQDTEENGELVLQTSDPQELIDVVDDYASETPLNYFDEDGTAMDLDDALESLGAEFDPHEERWYYRGMPLYW